MVSSTKDNTNIQNVVYACICAITWLVSTVIFFFLFVHHLGEGHSSVFSRSDVKSVVHLPLAV